MPRRANRPCRAQNCPKVHDTKEGYCPVHLEEHIRNQRPRNRRYNKDRSLNKDEYKLSRFYSTTAWKRLREAYITREPLCEHCTLRGRVAVGTMVDHIHERRDGGASLDMNNLQTLCHRCHAQKTADERGVRNDKKNK